MRSKITERLLRAIITLQNADGFGEFINWLRSDLEEIDKSNRSCVNDVILRMAQGEAQRLEYILSTCETASDSLDKMRRQPELEKRTGEIKRNLYK